MYQKNITLSKHQINQEKFFRTSEDSLSNWGMRKIEHFHVKSNITYNKRISYIMTRVIALLMPLFAVLDTFRYMGTALFKVAILRPKDAKFVLFKCGLSIKFFFTSIIGAFVSLYKPENVFRTESGWRRLMEKQIQRKLSQIIFDPQNKEGNYRTKCKAAMEDCVNQTVLDSNLRDHFLEIVDLICNEISDKPDIGENVVKTYVQFFSIVLVQCARENIQFSKNLPQFKSILTEMIRIRDPDLKGELLRNLFENFSEKIKIVEKFENQEGNQCLLPMYLVSQMTTNLELQDNFKILVEDKFFKQRSNHKKLVKNLFMTLQCNYTPSMKISLLEELISSFNKDLEKDEELRAEQTRLPKKNKNQIAALEDRVKVETEKLEGRPALEVRTKDGNKMIPAREGINEKIDQRKAEIEQLKDKPESAKVLKQKQDQLKVLESNKAKIAQKVEELENQIAELQQQDEEELQRDGYQCGKFEEYNRALAHSSILLGTESQVLVRDILSRTGEGKQFESLGDIKIINFLFKKVYELPDDVLCEENYKNIEALRAPWAFIKFHLRAKSYHGKASRQIVQTSKQIMISILKGSYWDKIHKTKNNKHLDKIFQINGLKEKWMNPPVCKVSDLIDAPSDQFKDFTIQVTKDPSDTLLVGEDMGSCVSLNGRIHKVLGLLGFVADGKFHTIVAKNNAGEPSSAETQIQLMWDCKNHCPVAYLEYIHYEGMAKGDHTLQKAIHAYAKQYAVSLGVPLVSCWEARDLKNKFLKNKYRGKVVSLGGASPVEYLNFKYGLNFGNQYNLCMMFNT